MNYRSEHGNFAHKMLRLTLGVTEGVTAGETSGRAKKVLKMPENRRKTAMDSRLYMLLRLLRLFRLNLLLPANPA